MQSNSNILEQIGGGPETVKQALKLISHAKPRTGPGSGHELGVLSTGLVPICGLLSSQRLRNDEITESAAQSASCLNKAQFKKAYQLVSSALQGTTNSGSLDPQTSDGLVSDYRTSAPSLQAFTFNLTKNLGVLKRQIAQDVRAKPATPSPTKGSTTPWRTGQKPKRELLAKQSPQKPAKTVDPEDGDDNSFVFPETPTKKRKLAVADFIPPSSASKFFETTIRASSSGVMVEMAPSPDRPGSPLKKSMSLSHPGIEMENAMDVPSEREHDEEPKSRISRRFRPVYLQQRQWNARDPRLKRLWRIGEGQWQRQIELHGNPFKI